MAGGALRVRPPRGVPASHGRRPPGSRGAQTGAPRPDAVGPPGHRRHAAGRPPPQRVTRRADIITDPVIGVIGPGRAGLGLALALVQAGYTVRLHGRRKKTVPKPLELTVGAGDEPPAWVAQAGVLILAVRDDAISPLAEALARAEAVRADQVVLHLSGAQGQAALASLVPSRAALGHLQSLTRDDALLYRALGRAALELAEKGGMDLETATRVAQALATDLPPVIRHA